VVKHLSPLMVQFLAWQRLVEINEQITQGAPLQPGSELAALAANTLGNASMVAAGIQPSSGGFASSSNGASGARPGRQAAGGAGGGTFAQPKSIRRTEKEEDERQQFNPSRGTPAPASRAGGAAGPREPITPLVQYVLQNTSYIC
jgi:hypothetical protein